ncbi:uncharacterized protein UHOD_11723 [Ustilago sp. UG-2017b]|nr:uncharacterized protein UHOD_11723 [Ustilago sp. UG-2017b]
MDISTRKGVCDNAGVGGLCSGDAVLKTVDVTTIACKTLEVVLQRWLGTISIDTTVMMTPRSGVSVDDDEIDSVGGKVGGIDTSVQSTGTKGWVTEEDDHSRPRGGRAEARGLAGTGSRNGWSATSMESAASMETMDMEDRAVCMVIQAPPQGGPSSRSIQMVPTQGLEKQESKELSPVKGKEQCIGNWQTDLGFRRETPGTGLYAKAEKCQFSTSQTEFLGFVVSDQGVSMDPSKTEVITNWPVPKSVHDVQVFLGFCNFYRKFIPQYSRTAYPLTQLLRKEAQSAPFAWNNEAQHAFEQLRSAFGTDTILRHFDPTRPIIVETDTSDFAVAAVCQGSRA